MSSICITRTSLVTFFNSPFTDFLFLSRFSRLLFFLNVFLHLWKHAYEFQPVAVETHGPLSVSSVSFPVDLGRKISKRTGEPLEVQFLFQRISVLIQRFNSVLFHETFPVEDHTNEKPFQLVFNISF